MTLTTKPNLLLPRGLVQLLSSLVTIVLLALSSSGCTKSEPFESEAADSALSSTEASGDEKSHPTAVSGDATAKTKMQPKVVAGRTPDRTIQGDKFLEDDLDRVERMVVSRKANLLLVAVRNRRTNSSTSLVAIDLQTQAVIWKISNMDVIQDLAIAPDRGEIFVWMTSKVWLPGRPLPLDQTEVESWIVSKKDGTKLRKRTMIGARAEGRNQRIAVMGGCFFSKDESEIALFDDRGLTILDPATLEEKRQHRFDAAEAFASKRVDKEYFEPRPWQDAVLLYDFDEVLRWDISEPAPNSVFAHDQGDVYEGRLSDEGLLLKGGSVIGYQVVQSGEEGVTGLAANELPYGELAEPIGYIPTTNIAVFPDDFTEYRVLHCMRVTEAGLESVEQLDVPDSELPELAFRRNLAMDREGKCVALQLNDGSIAVWDF